MTDPSVGVVLPAYRPDVTALINYVREIQQNINPATTIIELDSAQPGVPEQEHIEELPATVSVSTSRRGKGAAITHGLHQMETDILVFADSDGSVPAQSLASVIESVEAGEADIATGSRRHPDAEIVSHESLFKKCLGDVFAWGARRLISPKLYDYQCGAKAMTREIWTSIGSRIGAKGYGWDVELLGKASVHGATIVEVPIVWRDHPESTVSVVPTAAEMGRTLLATAAYQRRTYIHAVLGR